MEKNEFEIWNSDDGKRKKIKTKQNKNKKVEELRVYIEYLPNIFGTEFHQQSFHLALARLEVFHQIAILNTQSEIWTMKIIKKRKQKKKQKKISQGICNIQMETSDAMMLIDSI
jgi:hypothetical protein